MSKSTRTMLQLQVSSLTAGSRAMDSVLQQRFSPLTYGRSSCSLVDTVRHCSMLCKPWTYVPLLLHHATGSRPQKRLPATFCTNVYQCWCGLKVQALSLASQAHLANGQADKVAIMTALTIHRCSSSVRRLTWWKKSYCLRTVLTQACVCRVAERPYTGLVEQHVYIAFPKPSAGTEFGVLCFCTSMLRYAFVFHVLGDANARELCRHVC
eukprot:831030-Amphidinium_carterae.1